jgi:hypothetical protein
MIVIAGPRIDPNTLPTPDGTDAIAAAIASELGRDVDYRPVPTNGATRAAELIAELL